jgi:hypothetical protein
MPEHASQKKWELRKRIDRSVLPASMEQKDAHACGMNGSVNQANVAKTDKQGELCCHGREPGAMLQALQIVSLAMQPLRS